MEGFDKGPSGDPSLDKTHPPTWFKVATFTVLMLGVALTVGAVYAVYLLFLHFGVIA
jgi:hypothetical protein